jgi:DNA polymerase-4
MGVTPSLIQYEEEDFLPYARRWLDGCLGYSHIVEPEGHHAAFLELSALARAEEVVPELTEDLYNRIGICPRVGLASSKLVARIAADVCPGQPVAREEEFLARQPLERWWMVEDRILRRLLFLGFRTIGEVAALPVQALVRQFGREGIRIWYLAQGRDTSEVRAEYPRDEVYVRALFPQPVRLAQELEVGIRRAAERLSETLRKRDAQARKIVLTLEYDGFRVVQASRAFVRPLQSVGSLLTALRLTLRKIPIEEEVYALGVRLPDLEPVSASQASLLSSREEEKARRLEQSLRDRFGKDAIRRASEAPLERRDRLLALMQERYRQYGGLHYPEDLAEIADDE